MTHNNFFAQPPVLAQNDSVTFVTKTGKRHTLRIERKTKTWDSFVDGERTGWENESLRTAIVGGLMVVGMDFAPATVVAVELEKMLSAAQEPVLN